MMEVIKALILGVIEGVTEFLPVSSTGHLILFGEALSFTGPVADTFSIAIQLGAILAVVVLYPDTFLHSLTPKHWFSKQNQLILCAILPALVSGFFLYSTIKTHLFTPLTVIIALILGGVIMLFVEQINKKKHSSFTHSFETMTMKQSLIIGLCQCAALWPGMSRSGSTIVGGLLTGLSHEFAAKFSFIIAVPVMIIAVAYDLIKSSVFLNSESWILIAIGFIVSFIFGLMSMLTFLKVVSKFKLTPFALYRIIVGFIALSLYL